MIMNPIEEFTPCLFGCIFTDKVLTRKTMKNT